MSSSPVQVIKRLCQSQASSLNSQSQDLFAAQARIDQLTAELNQLKLHVRDIVAASESLLTAHQLEVAAHMTTQLALNVARSQADVPWDLNHVSLSTTAVSYKRLCLDIKFQSNMTAMTFFRAVDTMDAFFNVCLGFSYNVLPPARRSTSTKISCFLCSTLSALAQHLSRSLLCSFNLTRHQHLAGPDACIIIKQVDRVLTQNVCR
jgi:hypothetical protein